MSLLERFWVDTPSTFNARMAEIVRLHPGAIAPFELCRTAAGIPVTGYRLGRGTRQVVLQGRVHGHEPSGTCGLTALIESLASGKSPDTGKAFSGAGHILDAYTLSIFPMMNPTAAERFAAHFPDSYIGGLAAEAKAKGRFEEWIKTGYEEVLHEPGLALKKRRPPFFTEEDVKMLQTIGKPMGSMFTEDGVELWKDWLNGRASQTRALKEMMTALRPYLFIDVHNDSPPTRICPPTELKEKDAPLYRKLMEALYDGLESGSVPTDRRIYTPYLQQDDCQSVSWAYNTLGTIQFLYEVSGLGSKEDMLLQVWYGITALLAAALDSPTPQGR